MVQKSLDGKYEYKKRDGDVYKIHLCTLRAVTTLLIVTVAVADFH